MEIKDLPADAPAVVHAEPASLSNMTAMMDPTDAIKQVNSFCI